MEKQPNIHLVYIHYCNKSHLDHLNHLNRLLEYTMSGFLY